jgi:acyl-CoA thioester hydrolase
MFPMQTKSRRTPHMIAQPVPTPLITALRVRYAECDMQGHVFNGHYLTWFDLAHTEALRAATGMSYVELIEAYAIELVVAEANVRFRAAAHYDDVLEIAVAFEEPTTTSLTSRFTIRRDGDALTEGVLRHVCVDAKSYTKTPWPEAVRAALAPYVVSEASASTTTPSRPT